MPNKNDILVHMEDLARRIQVPCTLTHFGGCNMTLMGIKDATRDIDLILEPAHAWGEVVAAASNYDWTTRNEEKLRHQRPEDEGVLVAWEALQGPLDIDFFPPGRIFDVLTYSAPMRARRTMLKRVGSVAISLSDGSTTFLLKSITGRWRRRGEEHRDIEDLCSILDHGSIDWTFVAKEWRRQMAACPDPARATALAQDAMTRVREQGYRVRWTP